jgi:hypothetical protein
MARAINIIGKPLADVARYSDECQAWNNTEARTVLARLRAISARDRSDGEAVHAKEATRR